MTDRKPRKVIGSQAFVPPQRTEEGIVERIGLNVSTGEIAHPDGRVLVFHVSARHRGVPVAYKGAYWMRSGEGLVPMTADELRRVFDETVVDFSAEPVARSTIADLAPEAVDAFRRRWIRKSGNAALENLAIEQLLADAELVVDGVPTVAALLLFGTPAALAKHELAQAEVVFEYRGSEAVQNAVSPRDDRSAGSVFVRQFPRKVEIVSPGGFPPGITPANLLDHQLPRNRRLTEALARCGLVERSGQGANLMYEEAIKSGKPLPDFSASDGHRVSVVLRGEIESPASVRYLERLGKEKLESFSTHDLLVLAALRRDEPVPETLRQNLPRLVEVGAVEKIGKGRGTRYLRSRSLYAQLGEKGTYTRKRGLDRETNKELLLRHLRDAGSEGSPMSELVQVLPQLSRRHIGKLLDELRSEGRARLEGQRRGALWFSRGPSVLSTDEPL